MKVYSPLDSLHSFVHTTDASKVVLAGQHPCRSNVDGHDALSNSEDATAHRSGIRKFCSTSPVHFGSSAGYRRHTEALAVGSFHFRTQPKLLCVLPRLDSRFPYFLVTNRARGI